MKKRKHSTTILVYEPTSFDILACKISLETNKKRIKRYNNKNVYLPSKEYLEFQKKFKR